MTWVKICGMTNLEDALVAVDAGADAVGFVFYEKSPRCVTVEMAREIVEKLPGKVDKIGVFVNEAPERVSAVADKAGLTAVQLHGDEYKNPKRYSLGGKLFFCLPVVDVLREMNGQPASFFGLPKFPKDAVVLLDSGNQEQRGGTGRTFAWGEAHGFVSVLRKLYPVVIAGGLSSSNVAWAVEYLQPWGVDVASGVEASPGKKDLEKVRAFVRAVREMDRRVG
jgi:phosphoribosylanthranilate isomerase